jgi:hypothetical protein
MRKCCKHKQAQFFGTFSTALSPAAAMRRATLLAMLALARQPLAARCRTQQAVSRLHRSACARLYCTSQTVQEATESMQQQQQEHHSRLPPEQVAALQAAKEVCTDI